MGQKKICSCRNSKIRFPQKKIRRCVVRVCKFCISQTIYINLKSSMEHVKFSNTSLQNGYAILQFRRCLRNRVKNKEPIKNITCKCKRTSLFLKPFFSVTCVCVFCKTKTDRPEHLSDQFYIVSHKYRPGYCECGKTSTEVPWGEYALCGICGSIIGIQRHLSLGFLSLARRLPHFWYERFVGNPLRLLLGFTVKRYGRITGERENPFVLRNRNFIQLKTKPLRIARKDGNEFFLQYTICSYPWYCVYTHQI